MARIKMTRQLAHAAGWDAGNRAMRAGGHTSWSEEDYEAVLEEFRRLWPNCPHGCEPQNCCHCFTTLDNNGRKR